MSFNYIYDAQTRSLTFHGIDEKESKCTDILYEAAKHGIKRLDLQHGKFGDKTFYIFMRVCPQLEEINLSDCTMITAKGFAVAPFPSSLLCFTAQNTYINSPGVTHLSQSCPKLHYLDLGRARNTSFTEAKFPQSLLTLKVCETTIGTRVLQRIMQCCSKLNELDLTNCDKIDSVSFEQMPFPTQLKVIGLMGTFIDDEGIKNVASKCVALASIDLRECHYGITIKGILEAGFSKTLQTIAFNLPYNDWDKRKFKRIYPQLEL